MKKRGASVWVLTVRRITTCFCVQPRSQKRSSTSLKSSITGGPIRNLVALNPGSKLYAVQAGIKAVQEHMDRIGMEGTAEGAEGYLFSYRIRAKITGDPLISIIIPNKDSKKYLKQCVDSILEKSEYQNYEILIVENNSSSKENL